MPVLPRSVYYLNPFKVMRGNAAFTASVDSFLTFKLFCVVYKIMVLLYGMVTFDTSNINIIALLLFVSKYNIEKLDVLYESNMALCLG